MPNIQGKFVAWGGLEFKVEGKDNPFSQTVGEFRSFSAKSSDDSEPVFAAGGLHGSTEGVNVPGDSSMVWLRGRFMRFIKEVVPEDNSLRLSDFVFSLVVTDYLRATKETNREGWIFRLSEIESNAEQGGSSPLEIPLTVLLLDHTMNGRRI